MRNRIKEAIARINEKLNTTSGVDQGKLNKMLNKASLEELINYQALRVKVLGCGKLSLEESQTLYQIYGGESPSSDEFANFTIAEKMVGVVIGVTLEKIIRGSGGDIRLLLCLFNGEIGAVNSFLQEKVL